MMKVFAIVYCVTFPANPAWNECRVDNREPIFTSAAQCELARKDRRPVDEGDRKLDFYCYSKTVNTWQPE